MKFPKFQFDRISLPVGILASFNNVKRREIHIHLSDMVSVGKTLTTGESDGDNVRASTAI
jgi:hypothetical protein